MSSAAKRRELSALRAKIEQLEAELDSSEDGAAREWPPRKFYTVYHILAGFCLGAIGAMTGLLFNVIASLLIDQHPLYPLGEKMSSIRGPALLADCCLAIWAGMLLGIPLHLLLSRWFGQRGWLLKLAVATLFALTLWGILLQISLFNGNRMLETIPWWLAVSTLLVFGWTMVFVQPLGKFVEARSSSLELEA